MLTTKKAPIRYFWIRHKLDASKSIAMERVSVQIKLNIEH